MSTIPKKKKLTYSANPQQPPPKQRSKQPLYPPLGIKNSVAGDNTIKVKEIGDEC